MAESNFQRDPRIARNTYLEIRPEIAYFIM